MPRTPSTDRAGNTHEPGILGARASSSGWVAVTSNTRPSTVAARSSITELTLAASDRPDRRAFHMRTASPPTAPGSTMEKKMPM